MGVVVIVTVRGLGWILGGGREKRRRNAPGHEESRVERGVSLHE